MRKVLIPALAVLMSLHVGNAWAWSDVTGMIDRISAKTHRIVLDNGQTYVLQRAVKIGGFKKGEKVTISFEVQKGENVGNKMTKAKS